MTDIESVDPRALEHRIDSVRAVRQVLKAIWALARAELSRADAAAEEAAHYGHWADALVDRLLVPSTIESPPTFRVLIGPERPFAGSLPGRYLDHLDAPGPLGIVGRRLDEFANSVDGVDARVRFRLSAATSPAEAEECAARVAAAVLTHAGDDNVSLVHPFGPLGALVTRPLLSRGRSPSLHQPELFSPFADVVDAAVQHAVTARLSVALLEACRAEVRARIEMADTARKTCDRRLDELASAWRAARQTQITQEVVEIVAAGFAVEPET